MRDLSVSQQRSYFNANEVCSLSPFTAFIKSSRREKIRLRLSDGKLNVQSKRSPVSIPGMSIHSRSAHHGVRHAKE